MPDLSAWLDAVRQGVSAAESAGAFAQHVHVLPSTASTNDEVARAALVGAPQGHTVVAAEQTAGRGRRGASWHSPSAHGLYVSTLLRPDRWPVTRQAPDQPAASLITLMAGVAVASAVTDVCGARVELKWPNDVMATPGAATPGVGGVRPWRKLAGILAEGASDGSVLRTVVLGIGINVFRSAAPPDVAARMIALEQLIEPAGQADPASLVRPLVTALLTRLAQGVDQLSAGRLAEVRRQWTDLAPSVDGTPVRWHHHGVTREGRARGIDETGALRVLVDGTGDVVVHGGEVEWLVAGGAHDA